VAAILSNVKDSKALSPSSTYATQDIADEIPRTFSNFAKVFFTGFGICTFCTVIVFQSPL
jgi:hypothetical protein